MKDRKETRMNLQGWELKSLRHLGRFRKGLTITKADLLEDGIPCLNYGEVHSRYPFEVNQDVQPLRCVDSAYNETNPEASVSSGDFVFADTSEDFEGVGNFTLVTGESPLFAGYHTIIYSLSSEVNPRFLAYSLDSFPFRTQLRLSVKGIKVFSITQEILRGARVLLPPMDQQQSIAKLLDEESARIDSLIAKKTRFIELLKEKRQAVITKAVTKGLDDSVEMKDSGVEWIGEIPSHWVTGKLRWFAKIQTGIALGKEYKDQSTVKLPYLRVANVQAGYVDLSEVKELELLISDVERYALKAGDVLMNEGGDNDKLGRGTVWKDEIAPCVHQNHVFAIRTDERLLPEWLSLFTQSTPARAYFFTNSKQSTNLASISSRNLTSLGIPLPSVGEQKEIIASLNNEMARIDTLIAKTERSIELLKEKCSALITAAVTGKIDVREAA